MSKSKFSKQTQSYLKKFPEQLEYFKKRAEYGRILTRAERDWCNENEFTHGIDIDTTPFQFSHVVDYKAWRKDITINPAICKTEDLWFVGGAWGQLRGDGKTRVDEDDRLTCETCLKLLEEMIKTKSVQK